MPFKFTHKQNADVSFSQVQYLPCLFLQQKLLLMLSLGGTCVQHALPTGCCTPKNAVLLPPEKPLARQYSAKCSDQAAQRGCRLIAHAALLPNQQQPRILATTETPYWQWKQTRVYCTSLRQVSPLSAARLVHPFLLTTGHTMVHVLVCIN